MSYADEIHRLAAEERQEEHDHATAFMEGFRTFAETVRNMEPEPELLQDPRCTAAELAEAFSAAASRLRTSAEAMAERIQRFNDALNSRT